MAHVGLLLLGRLGRCRVLIVVHADLWLLLVLHHCVLLMQILEWLLVLGHEHVIGDSLLLLDSGLGTCRQFVCCCVGLGVETILWIAVIDDLTLVI